MRELFTANLKLKIIAILLALLAWSYVHSTSPSVFLNSFTSKERKVNLTVQYLNLQQGLTIVNSTDEVELLLREGLRTFGSNQSLRAFVDLSQIEEQGDYYLEIKVEIPKWMKLLNQRPKYALIHVQEVKK